MDGDVAREGSSHSFVIRIWLEETAEEAGQSLWRGHITHVTSEKRAYLKELDDIRAFVVPYLREMRVEVPQRDSSAH